MLCAWLSNLQAPVARREPHPTHIHAQTLQDDYFWLREKESPEVLAYLTAENDYTAAHLAGTEDLQASLYREMLSHIKETDTSLPGARRRVVLLHTHHRGKAVPDPLPPTCGSKTAPITRTRRKRCCWT